MKDPEVESGTFFRILRTASHHHRRTDLLSLGQPDIGDASHTVLCNHDRQKSVEWCGPMRVRSALVLLVTILATGCGGGLSTVEYAEEVETLVTTMNARLDQLDAESDGTQDLDRIKRYATERVSARSDFVSGLADLEPPDDVEALHETALEIMERLTSAESVMADRVMQWESASDIDAIWETPEGVAARAADTQAVSLCLAAQAEFDQTGDRTELKDVPWIPAEMKAVVLVAFGCDSDAR